MKTQFKFLLLLAIMPLAVMGVNPAEKENADREYWTKLCYKISQPILENMSKGELQKQMTVIVSPTWDNRDVKVTYMEAFGRLMAGITPWLSLPDDNTQEGKQRKQLREWALKSYANAVDPENADYLGWDSKSSQTLVDAAYIAVSFIRAPESIWNALPDVTKERYIQEFKKLRKIRPAYNNWLLFRASIEAFLLSIGEEADGYVLRTSFRKLNEWYVGDGFYNDGSHFALDYYNSFVIHPMMVEGLEVLETKGQGEAPGFSLALKRMQRFNSHLERLISPEGTFPPIGRSITYRMGAFQTLALAAWKYELPKGMSDGQVRGALTSVMKNMFNNDKVFTPDNYLTLGFVGQQDSLADYYTNNGSLYLTSLVFLPLGLPANANFWTSPEEDWTSKKAWSGKEFPKDYNVSLKSE